MIKVESLVYKYADGTKALNNVNLNLEKGNVIGIIGANGSGKSTLLLNIIGILKPNKGIVKYKNKPIKYNKSFLREYRQKVNIVFQDPDKQLFYSNVYDDIAFSLRNLGYREEEIQERVNYTLKKVKAYDLKDKPTHFLSYGQKKRIAIAGILVMDLDLILFDEPTSGLDPHMTKEIKDIIKNLSQEKKILISSHDMDLIYEICDYVYILGEGEILGEGSPAEVFLKEDLLKRAYLEKPWLVKVHQTLGLPLYKNEEELFEHKGRENKMKKGIIVVSFGTTYEEARRLSIESIENKIREEYKDYLVLRAFTSQMVINKLKKRDNYFVDNPKEALEKMKEEGIQEIYIQPLHIIPGHEYEKLLRQVNSFLEENPDFQIKTGKPLLYSSTDYENLVDGLGLNRGETIVFMGHGTDHQADIFYKKLEKTFRDKAYRNVYVATVEGETTLEDIIPDLKANNIQDVKLRPFMLVAGDHAINDMASDEEDSWESILKSNGFNVVSQIEGLGEVEAIQNIYLRHLEESID